MWPGNPGIRSPNTPTLIEYDCNDKSAFSWGYKVHPTSKSKIEGINLLLDPDQVLPLYVPFRNSKKNLQRLGKLPMDVAWDYIGTLYQYSLATITESYPKDFVDVQQKKFIMTHPAVWSDKVKDLTLRVCQLYYVWKSFY
jgi:hypothetical protein